MISSIELFSGIGGLALGLHSAGFEPCALIEWNKESVDSLNSNINTGYPGIENWDVRQVDIRFIKYGEYEGKADFVTGGPPCQPFSIGGKHKAFTDSRDMFPEAVRAVKELRPKGFIFENVRGLLRKSFNTYFNYIIFQLTTPISRRKKVKIGQNT